MRRKMLMTVLIYACLFADIGICGDSNKNSDMEFIQQYAGAKPELGFDKAWFTINSTVNFKIEIWAQSDQCYKCDLMFIDDVPKMSTHTILVNTSFSTTLELIRVHPGGTPRQKLCRFDRLFEDEGDYWIFIDYPAKGTETKCNLILANDPPNVELPILYVILGLAGLAVVYTLGKFLFRYLRKAHANRKHSMDINTQSDPEGVDMGQGNQNGVAAHDTSEKDEPKKQARLRSLDTFRGMTLSLMIFVNTGGAKYWFFEHAAWNGIYIADLVFPWFVFIMGTSMTFSFRSMFKKEMTILQIFWKVFWRSVKLFAFGFMWGTVHWVVDLPNGRIFGVLQRLALTYFITAVIHLCVARRADSHEDKSWAALRDIILNIPEWLFNLAILGLHLAIIYGVSVPGCPRGYVGAGGLSESGKYWNCTGGATQYLDEKILGATHIYKWPTPRVLYQTDMAFDPEGLIGTLGCVFLCFLGIQCGRIFLVYKEVKQRVIRFLIWATLLGALGALLTKCSQNEGWIPPNKNLWSLSYSLICGCFGYILLTILYLVIDVFKVWLGQPMVYPGMNSILIYICHGVFYKMFPINWKIDETHANLLLQHVWVTAFWVIVSYWLYVKKIFIVV